MNDMIENTIEASDITFQFITQEHNPDLMKKYAKMRQEVFTDYWKLEHFEGELDVYDNASHVLVIMHKDKCVGGARLVVHEAGSALRLPMETDEFLVETLCPDLPLHWLHYAELSRVAILEGYRNGAYADSIYQMVEEKCKELDVHYVFAVAPIPQARRSRRSCRALGMKAEILSNVAVPELPTYEGIAMRLSIVGIGDVLWPYDEAKAKKLSESV